MVQEVLQRKRESWSWGALWLAIGSWQWPTESNHWSWSVTTTGEFAEELNINHSIVIWYLKQIGKVKRLNKWVPHEPMANQKAVILKCCLLLFYATTNHFSIGLGRAPKWGFIPQQAMTSSVVGWRINSKALPKAKLAPQNSHGYCLVVCCQSDPVQLSGS